MPNYFGMKTRGVGLLATSPSLPQPPVPILWLQADLDTYTDTARTTPAVLDGAIVRGWTDQTGNGHHATQADASKAPTLRLNVKNGLPVVRFDTTDDWMTLGGTPVFPTASASTPCFTFFLANISPGIISYLMRQYTTGSDPLRYNLEGAYPGLGTFFHWKADTWEINSGVDVRGAWHLLCSGKSDDSLAGTNLYIDGALVATGQDAGAFANIATTLGGASLLLGADVAEVITYHLALSEQERIWVESYLNEKWAIW